MGPSIDRAAPCLVAFAPFIEVHTMEGSVFNQGEEY